MKMFWFSWVLAVVTQTTAGEIPLDMALSLAKHFGADFCVIEKPEEPSDFALISTKENPSRAWLLTTFLSFPQISEFMNENVAFKHGGRTMIVLTSANDTLSRLVELSHQRSLSPVIWVLFSDFPFDSYSFRNIHVPFDCEFVHVSKTQSGFSFTEIYQIGRETEIEAYHLGYWTEEGGLDLPDVQFYSRRSNLKGHRLKAIIKNNPPYVSVSRGAEGNLKFSGYLYEIWSELEFRLNFRSERIPLRGPRRLIKKFVTIRTDFLENYLDKDPNEVLREEEVDFAVARISILPSALDCVDFSQPIHEAKTYLFGHRPGTELDWDSYLKPFSPNTWFVSIAWLLSSSLALALLYRKAWDFGTSEREANYYVFTFPESLLTVFRAVCMQGSDITPRSNSCRLFFLSIYLTALVVTSAFSAALFSLLTIPKPRSPFSSLQEVLNNKFKIGFPFDPDFHKLVEDFSATLPSSDKRNLLEKLTEAKNYPPASPREGIEQVCIDKFYIFAFDLPNVLYIIQNTTRSCQDKILPSGPALFTEFIGIAFKKKNPYRELINFHLIRMKSEGILKRLLLNYWPPQIPTVQATWVRVTLSDISPILYMFTLGAILGTVFLHGEKILLYFRLKKRKKVETNRDEGLLHDQEILLSGLIENRSPKWGLYYKINHKN